MGHLSKLDAVKKLIPGRINKVKKCCDKFEFRVTTETSTGVKALARLNRSVQEVFITFDSSVHVEGERQAVEDESKLIIDKYWKKLK